MAISLGAALGIFAGAMLLVMLIIYILRVLVILLAVNMLGGEATFWKVFFTELILTVATGILKEFGAGGQIIAAIATLIVYMAVYALGFVKAIIALVIIFILVNIVPVLLGYIGIMAS